MELNPALTAGWCAPWQKRFRFRSLPQGAQDRRATSLKCFATAALTQLWLRRSFTSASRISQQLKRELHDASVPVRWPC